jgi:outer membrane protein assembly factor BamB
MPTHESITFQYVIHTEILNHNPGSLLTLRRESENNEEQHRKVILTLRCGFRFNDKENEEIQKGTTMILRLTLLLVLCFAALPVKGEMHRSAVMQNAQGSSGLIVVVGCEDVGLLIELAGENGCLVHALDDDFDQVAEAIIAFQSEGIAGKASAATFDGRLLPYVDNLVNLLIMKSEDTTIPESEILRVLAPGGKAILGDERIVKAIPPELDDWSHHMYDASGIGAGNDTAVAQPRSIQWKAGPEYGRSHENMSSVSAVVSAGGRVFSIIDEGPLASVYLPSEWFLTARDAFSGVQLWKIPIPQWHTQLFPLKSGPLQLPRRLVATENRVYVTLGLDSPVTQLDAASGEILSTYEETQHAEELIYTNEKLLVVCNDGSSGISYRGNVPADRRGIVLDEQSVNMEGNRSVVCVNTETNEIAWQTPPGAIIPLTLASDGQYAFFLRHNELICAELSDGEEVWSVAVNNNQIRFGTASSPTLLVYEGIVYVGKSEVLTAYDSETSAAMWSAPCAGAGYRAQASIFILNNLIWDVSVGGEPYRPGTPPDLINRYYTGYDLQTGDVIERMPVSSEHGYGIMHHRCHIPRASGNNIITSFPGIEFFDVETGESTHDSWIRGACLYGFMPANGLLYTPPHPCACYTQGKLTGFLAVAGQRDVKSFGGYTPRQFKGPAFYDVLWKKSPPRGDWPTYRGDVSRSGTTPVSVPVNLSEQWITDVGQNLSQCVIAEGKLFVATREDHTVHALNAENGSEVWRFTAGGRVDSPPTYYNETVIFGSHDGYVYCLTAAEGNLVWKFRAATYERRCVAYDQVESVWPVHGSVLICPPVRNGSEPLDTSKGVLIHDRIVWCCAGRSSFLDGGLVLCRLDPGSGNLLSCEHIHSLNDNEEQPPITSSIFARLDMEGAKNDVLSCDGEHVFMRHWAFNLEGKSVTQEIDHLFSPTGFLDASWFRRTYWIYGRTYVSGAQGWARTGNARPSGRIMSIDDECLYGFGRDYYPPSPGNGHQMYLAGERERLYAAEMPTSSPVLDSPATAPRSKPTEGTDEQLLWSTPGDIQVRGMLLAGEGTEKRLFINGAKGDWVTSPEAYEGILGSVLRVVSIEDGAILAEYDLPGLTVFDGMSAAGGKLYISLVDGRLLCLGEDVVEDM